MTKAKTSASSPRNKTAAKKDGVKNDGLGSMKNFEERLERLEILGDQIRKADIPLDEALQAFEEGIKLARALEKDLEKIDNRIEILMNSADACQEHDNYHSDDSDEEAPELELFKNGD